MNKDKKIVYGFDGANNGCNFYRIKQPFSKLKGIEDIIAISSSDCKTIEEQSEAIDASDVLVSQNGMSEKYLIYIKENKGKKKFVLDYDDNIFSVGPYNPSYAQHGTKEVDVFINGERRSLWKDGENGFDIKRNENTINIFTETLKSVDMVTTPSINLARKFRDMGARNVRVIANKIDFGIWKQLNLVKDDKVRIGYQGGWSHYEDWLEIKDAIKEVVNSNDKAILVIYGQCYQGTLEGIDPEKIVVEDWVNIEAYPYKFRSSNIDIGIAPLKYNEFNVCKSEIKWEEYSALGIPCIASNIPPYSNVIEHEKTGLLASNTGEWIEYLNLLINDKTKRDLIGNTAMKKAREKYDIDNGLGEYVTAYQSLFRRFFSFV